MGEPNREEKIRNTLNERIVQLETELRYTKEVLYSEKTKKDDLENAIELLQEEANNVIAQWEGTAAQEKKKVEKLLKELQDSKSERNLLKEREQQLEDKLRQAQQSLAAKEGESQLIKGELQSAKEAQVVCADEISILQNEKKDMLEKLMSRDASFTELAEKVSAAKELNSQLNTELQAKKRENEDFASENSTLKQHLRQVSTEAEKLLHRTIELNEKNIFLEMTIREQKGNLESMEVELNNLRSTSNEVREEKQTLEEKVQRLEYELQKSTSSLAAVQESLEIKLSETLDIVASQSDAFSQLDKKYKEIQNEKSVANLKCSELNTALISLNEEFKREKNEKDIALSKVESLKAQLLSFQKEFVRLERDYEKVIQDEKQKEEKRLIDSKILCELAEKKYDALLASHSNLVGVLSAYERRSVMAQERNERYGVEFSYVDSINIHLLEFVKEIQSFIRQKHYEINLSQSQLKELSEENKKISHFLAETKAAYEEKNLIIEEQKRITDANEDKLSGVLCKVKEIELDNSQLKSENTFMKDQVNSLTKELNEVDSIIISQVKELQEINENVKKENKILKSETAQLLKEKAITSEQLKELDSQFRNCHLELMARSKALDLTESELILAKNKEHSLSLSLSEVNAKLAEYEAKTTKFSALKASLECTAESFKSQLEQATEKFNLILTNKRVEIETLRGRLTKTVELLEKHESSLSSSAQTIQNYESTIANLKSVNSKLKNASSKDNDTLKALLQEKEDFIKERNSIVEKYNKLHEALCSSKKESAAKVTEEMKKVVLLCSSQEAELQTLRRQNLLLKNSLSMFVTTSPPKAETIFTERLNLTEGPLRHPKKRAECIS